MHQQAKYFDCNNIITRVTISPGLPTRFVSNKDHPNSKLINNLIKDGEVAKLRDKPCNDFKAYVSHCLHYIVITVIHPKGKKLIFIVYLRI